jgi:hypothetical protein
MAKIVNLRERIHQPYRDALCRTAGLHNPGLSATTDLFITQGRDEGFTNLKTSAQLPNDSSMIILAARVLQWFRAPVMRALDAAGVVLNGDVGSTAFGDAWDWPDAAGEVAIGNAIGNYNDVYRLHWQCAEGLFWTVGAGEKDSLRSMPSMYFPYGGGLQGAIGGPTDLIHFHNGQASHTSILRVARAITITPRQTIKVSVTGMGYFENGAGTVFGTSTAQGRNMNNPIHNLNAVDGIAKVVSMTLDGLVSRDVQ